jgi:UPF0042 nucleotide-binding protein
MTVSRAPVRFVVITGMSGAGRRTASHALEDLGWYIVDNLPPSMLPDLLQVAVASGYPRVAVVLDVRTRAEFDDIPRAFDELAELGVQPQILFLDADTEVIVRRQESVRRPHPLQGEGRMVDGISREREMLSVLRGAADVVIDTSVLNVHQLRSRVAYAFEASEDREPRVTLVSFGFKNGIPVDVDVVFDVRFLPNPHWIPALRPQTGLSEAVSSYVLGFAEAQTFLERAVALVESTIPGYLREGKRLVSIGIGCTGGKHRSTAMAEELARRLGASGLTVRVVHRDLGNE